MFVAIDNKDMDALEIEKWINANRDENGGIISPEFAMEILTKTNYFAHIKKVLKNIKDNCKTSEEIAPYKEFILASIEGREVSPQAMADLVDLAEKGGFVDEFNECEKEVKKYTYRVCNTIDVESVAELNKEAKNNRAITYHHKRDFYDVEIENVDLSNVEVLNFDARSRNLYFTSCRLPKIIDTSIFRGRVFFRNCDLKNLQKLHFFEQVDMFFQNCVNLPEWLDISKFSEINFGGSDLANLKELKFKDGAQVYLSRAYNLPKDIDFSKCSQVFLENTKGLKGVVDLSHLKDLKVKGADFGEVSELKLPKSHVIDLTDCVLPENLDLSEYSVVHLSGCDLKKVKNIKFKKDSTVYMGGAVNIPENLDVSMCHHISFAGCDLKNLRELKFKDGAYVCMARAYNLPEDIDFSKCKEADLEEAKGLKGVVDLSNMREIKIKNSDLSEVSNLILSEGYTLDLSDCVLPENLDLSKYSEIYLKECDFKKVKNIKFREDCSVYMSGAKNLPNDLDFSKCRCVALAGCDVSNFEGFKFKYGATVYLAGAYNFPKKVDFSELGTVALSNQMKKCDLSGIEEIKFKNETQLSVSGFNYIFEKMKNFTGKVVIADKALINNNDFCM